ncbi:class I SAM-dependent methyltransferase [Mesorhizobium sp. M0894]
MSGADSIIAIYDNYYAGDKVHAKREIASVQSVDHVEDFVQGEIFDTILDIGGGEGAVLDKLNKRGFGKTLAAVEISSSGIEVINSRKIPNLESVLRFDGYHIPHPDKSFDLGLAIPRGRACRARTDVSEGGGSGLQEALYRSAFGTYARSQQSHSDVGAVWAYQLLHDPDV